VTIEKHLWLRLSGWTNFNSGYADAKYISTRLWPLQALHLPAAAAGPKRGAGDATGVYILS